MAYPYEPAMQTKYLTVTMTDVSAPSSVFVAPGFDGRIRRITSSLGGAITVADSILTTKINAVAVTNGGWTVSQSGSAAGDVDQAIPTALNVFRATDFIRFDTDGGSTTTQPLTITMELEPV
jgi:hypothetical protein